jgi:predicted nucleic acid-binding protein
MRAAKIWPAASLGLVVCAGAFLLVIPAYSNIETHQIALGIAKRHKYHIYGALVIASALEASCTTLYSEDLQDGQAIGGLTIRNPFRKR